MHLKILYVIYTLFSRAIFTDYFGGMPAIVGQLVSDEDEANALKVPSLEAGRAFEGAGISCGCSSIDGAIDKVTADIGLIPNELTDRTTILGNAALSGAIRVLLCPEENKSSKAYQSFQNTSI